MADTRIMLTCKHCGAGMCIGKGYDGSYYTVNKNMFQDLNAFYEVHEQGKCSDDADYSQDAKNHFVILEEGETLADAVPKSEVAREIFEEIEKIIQKNYDSAQNNEEDEELEAATDYLSYVSYDIDKLKKKYIGRKTDEDTV